MVIMAADDWPERQRILASAGILVLASAKERIQEIRDIQPLIEAARSSGVRMLDSRSVDELLSLVPNHEGPVATQIPIRSEQSTLPDPQSHSSHGRVVAPSGSLDLAPPPRPHGLSYYDLADFPMQARDVDAEIEIHFDITGHSVTEGRMSDMKSCFTDRLRRIRSMMISSNVLPRRPISTSEAWRNRQRHSTKEYEITMVGLASEMRWTKNKNLMFVIEDEASQISCLVKPPSDAPETHPALDGLMNDDVIGVSGSFLIGERDPIFFVQDIHLPPLGRHSKNSAGQERAISAAFLSDMHVGSMTFLGPQWEKMIQWFKTDPLARTIKYFVLSGDGVDGVGIYPGQDRHLAIKDLFQQYGELARLLEDLPDWVDVIILPGNHDAVRPAEPQPALDPEVQQDYSDTTFVGNPCDFSLNGVRVLSYHGKSIDDFVATLRSVSYSKPERAMQAMLERRHLAPSWGGKTPLSPEPEDNLVISTIPDIFVTGHVHGHFVGSYKGTTMVHSSTWQNQTDFQRMLGFQPKPCILTVVNLHTFATASIPFA
jgi:DNA polymerase II small subunit